MTQLHIQNGRIIDPKNDIDFKGDLLIEDGKIIGVGKVKPAKDAQVIDATDKIIAPGLIDLHVHFREPGGEGKETILTGSQSAVAGGFTGVCLMPNTNPTTDNRTTVNYVHGKAKEADLCNIYVSGAMTKGREGKELAEMHEMNDAGVIAFTDDGTGVQSSSMMLKVFKYASQFDKVLMQHCQDNDITKNGCMNSGYRATVMGVPGMSGLAEDLMIARDIILVQQTTARYHVQHLSTKEAVDIIRDAKGKGVSITTEVSPHHLLLNEDHCKGYNTNCKMNPPLRTPADIEGLIKGVKDGTIDILATDHAPHLASEKDLEFINAPSGLVGLECALGLYVKALVDPGHVTINHVIKMMTIGQAEILDIERGTLSVGAVADVTIIDDATEWEVDVDKFYSKSRNCPWGGWQLHTRATHTIVAGVVKFPFAS